MNQRALSVVSMLALFCLFPELCLNSDTARVVRILPFGDSLTAAFDGQASYRYWLWRYLQNMKVQADFVGTEVGVSNGSPAFGNFDQDHEGHVGWTARDAAYFATEIARATQPDVVLLDFGGNDIEMGFSFGQITADLKKIIRAFRTQKRNVAFLVSLPCSVAKHKEKLPRLHSHIRALVKKENRHDSLVIVVDHYAGWSAKAHTYDGVHPNRSGEKRLASKWHAGLVKVL